MEMVTEKELYEIWIAERELRSLAKLLKCGMFDVADRVENLVRHVEELEAEKEKLIRKEN